MYVLLFENVYEELSYTEQFTIEVVYHKRTPPKGKPCLMTWILVNNAYEVESRFAGFLFLPVTNGSSHLETANRI
jgi:hypothetical protein